MSRANEPTTRLKIYTKVGGWSKEKVRFFPALQRAYDRSIVHPDIDVYGISFCPSPTQPSPCLRTPKGIAFSRLVFQSGDARYTIARHKIMGTAIMAKRSTVKVVKGEAAKQSHQQKGTQQGHNTGKEAWKSNLEYFDTQPGPGQEGQHPRKGEEWGSTPGEVRGHKGGKRGQAMGGKRGTKNSMKAKSKKRAAKKAKK